MRNDQNLKCYSQYRTPVEERIEMFELLLGADEHPAAVDLGAYPFPLL